MSYVDVGNDIQERNGQHLPDTSRLVAMGELAAGVAHNFGNVLMVVSMTLELLHMRAKTVPALDDMVETITGAQAEVTRGAEIIQRLLSLARKSPTVLTAVNPKQVTENVLALCATHLNAKRVALVDLIPDEPPRVKADANQLEEVIVNLVLNALQASEGGAVKVELQECEDDRLAILVTDNGCGIAPEDMNKLFDPFFTRRKGGSGTGLGLPCSLAQINGMGGTIAVRSKLGVGSTFTVNLPKWVEH